MPFVRTALERFWSFVDKDGPNGCWLWTGYRGGTKGKQYGQFNPGTRAKDPKVYTHVFAYELLVGPVPDGLELDHTCNVRLCCNPDHLEPVTHKENIRRAFRWCRNGHNLSNPQNRHPKRRGCYACYKTKHPRGKPIQTPREVAV